MYANRYPLSRHCLLDSGNASEVKDQVSQHLWSHRMSVRPGADLHSRMYGVRFGSVALYDLHYGAEVEIDAGDISSYYLFRATLHGTGEVQLGRQRAAMRAGSLTVSSPSERSALRFGKDCRNLILRVERQPLERQLQQLLQRPLRQPLVFEVEAGNHAPGAEALRETLRYLCRLYQFAPDGAGRTLSAGFDDYLLSLLLMQLPHNYSQALQGDARQPLPAHVRKARDYIDAHADEAIPLAELAAHCGVSVRTLQNGFLRFLGQNPSDYMRSQRLERVHAALQRAGAEGGSVTEVLLRHGVTSFGHFATHYRKRFGCLPSDTLHKHRG